MRFFQGGFLETSEPAGIIASLIPAGISTHRGGLSEAAPEHKGQKQPVTGGLREEEMRKMI
ncbi:MAG: hypothetical protein N3E46_05265 [Gemmataceae bacterium]|nr:hypothetical protein [Gemmataceae bacterium]